MSNSQIRQRSCRLAAICFFPSLQLIASFCFVSFHASQFEFSRVAAGAVRSVRQSPTKGGSGECAEAHAAEVPAAAAQTQVEVGVLQGDGHPSTLYQQLTGASTRFGFCSFLFLCCFQNISRFSMYPCTTDACLRCNHTFLNNSTLCTIATQCLSFC
jgi:hypothetical protein